MLRPGNAGTLHHAGQVEVISSVHRDGSPVENDLRWGVFVVFEAPNDYAPRCFQEYGVVTDQIGRVSALYRPFHLIGLELNVSILSAALRREPTGAPAGFRGDVVSTAKRDLRAGEMLDGEGGACVWGKLMTAADSLRAAACRSVWRTGYLCVRDVPAGQPVTWDDVADRYGGRRLPLSAGDGGGVSGGIVERQSVRQAAVKERKGLGRLIPFKVIRARAEKRKGGAKALNELLPPPTNAESLRQLTDDRVLAEMAKRVSQPALSGA